MLAVARKDEYKYPVTREWKAGVRAELKRRGRGSHAKLCKEIDCSTGELTELLGPESKLSNLVAPIHRAFKWRMPQPPLPGSPDVPELDHLIDRLRGEERKLIAVAVDALRGAVGEEQKNAIIAMLKVIRAPQNDQH